MGRQAGSPQGPGARYGAPLPAPRAQASAGTPPPGRPGSQPGPQLACPSPACAGSLETPAALRSPLCARPPRSAHVPEPTGSVRGVISLSVGPRGGLGLRPGPHVPVLGWGTAAAVPAWQTGMQDRFAGRGFMVPKAAEPPAQEPGEEEPGSVRGGRHSQTGWAPPAAPGSLAHFPDRMSARCSRGQLRAHTGTADPYPAHAASSPGVTQVPLGAAHPMPTCIQSKICVYTRNSGADAAMAPLLNQRPNAPLSASEEAWGHRRQKEDPGPLNSHSLSRQQGATGPGRELRSAHRAWVYSTGWLWKVSWAP